MAGFENNVLVAKNINFDEAGSKPHLGIINAAGKIPIGTGNSQPTPEILAGSLTSPLGTIAIGYSSPNITLDITGGANAIETITGDSGSISGNAVTIFANNVSNNSGATVKFTNAGTISTLNVTDVNLNTFIGKNSGVALAGSGHTGIGYGTFIQLTGASALCTAVGYQAGVANTSGSSNTSCGASALYNVTSGSGNTGCGRQAGTMLSTGSNNTYLGLAAGGTSGPQTGSYNTIIGANAGSNWGTTESSNIYLGVVAGASESNVMRLGTTGSGSGQVNQTFVAGVTGVTSSNPQYVTINSSTGQLGVSTYAAVGTVLLSTQTATNSASISFTSLITNAYSNYFMTFTNVSCTTDNLQMLLSADNGSNYLGSGYSANLSYANVGSSALQVWNNQFFTDKFLLTTGAPTVFSGTLNFYGFASSYTPFVTGFLMLTSNLNIHVTGTNSTTGINAIKFSDFGGGGNVIIGGTFNLYGVL